MRALAGDLGVTPMALYRHVDGRDDLLEGVVDHALDTLGAIDAGDHPDEVLRGLDRRIGLAFGDLPEVALLLVRKGPRTARSLAFIESVVAALVATGLDEDEAAATYATVSTLALARVAAPAVADLTVRADDDQPHARRALGHLTRSDVPTVDAITAAAATLHRPGGGSAPAS